MNLLLIDMRDEWKPIIGKAMMITSVIMSPIVIAFSQGI